MQSLRAAGEVTAGPLRGELRYGLELARLVVDPQFRSPRRHPDHPPALLVPGFMAGDQSLAVLASWLRRRGGTTARAGIFLNTDCAERAVTAIEARVRRLAERTGERVVLIGQSRGGGLARAAAVRNPDVVSTVIMLGSPVVAPLDVGPAVLGAVRSVARLGDLGFPRMFSSECRDGDCCAAFRDAAQGPLPPRLRAVSIYSRSDGIVSWTACLDPHAEHVEVDSSHTGMSVNADVYEVIGRVFDEAEPVARVRRRT